MFNTSISTHSTHGEEFVDIKLWFKKNIFCWYKITYDWTIIFNKISFQLRLTKKCPGGCYLTSYLLSLLFLWCKIGTLHVSVFIVSFVIYRLLYLHFALKFIYRLYIALNVFTGLWQHKKQCTISCTDLVFWFPFVFVRLGPIQLWHS